MLLLGCNLKNDRMISVCFQGNHSNHSTPSLCPNHWCWRSCSWPVLRRLKDFLDLTPKHYVLFIIRGWNAKVGSQGSESHSVTSDSLWPHVLYSPWNSPGQNIGVGSLSLLQGIFLTQGSNPGLPHCRWILYQLSYKGSPRILEWVAYPFSRGSSRPRNWTRVSCIAGGFFTNWAIRETIHGIFQAIALEWVAIVFSNSCINPHKIVWGYSDSILSVRKLRGRC